MSNVRVTIEQSSVADDLFFNGFDCPFDEVHSWITRLPKRIEGFVLIATINKLPRTRIDDFRTVIGTSGSERKLTIRVLERKTRPLRKTRKALPGGIQRYTATKHIANSSSNCE